jgi:hypothetical protein
MRAFKTWPALIFLLPLPVWARLHLPFVLGLTIGGSSGISGLPLAALLRDMPMYVLGTAANGVLVFAIVAASMAMAVRREGWPGLRRPSPETLALCGIGSIAMILVIACLRPGFSRAT